jgi:hypothetical protein
VQGEQQERQVRVLQQVQRVWRDQVLPLAQRVQQVQAQRRVRQVLVDITPPKIPITITRTCIVLLGFILILLEKQMDQVHTMQVIRTQGTDMGIMLITSTMVIITVPHHICQTTATQPILELMPPLMSSFNRMALFTVTVITENTNPITMMR